MGQFLYSEVALSTLDYTATGGEGMTLVIPALVGASIALLTYNTLVLIPESPITDSSGYSFNSGTGTFTFGLNLQPNDVLQILFIQ